MDNDLTANTYGTIERDQNGEVAALIKVVTLEKGFVFDGGIMGIVKTVQKAGEIWVYVPYGLQRITISHPEFGIIRNYFFPESIEKARTYELVLKAAREVSSAISVDTYVEVSFENAMTTSDIYLNGIKIATGSWSGSIIATTYLVEVKQDGYISYSTTITLNPDEQGQIITIPELEEMKGSLLVTSQPVGAAVYLDGKEVGTTPLQKSDIPVGKHSVELRKKDYRTAVMEVEVKEGEINNFSAELIDEFTLTINTDPAGAQVSLNGENKGNTPYTTLLKSGDYLLRITKPGYIPYKKNVHLGGDNPDLSFKLERKILSSNNFYAGGGYTVGHASGIDAYAGLYLFNVNMEAGYNKHANSSSTVWWMEDPSSWSGQQGLEYEYSVESTLSASVGYGILFGNRTRITPRLGAVYSKIYGKYKGGYSGNMDQTSYVISGRAGVRAEYSPIPHIGIVCTPSFDIPLMKGELASQIDATSDLIKKWCSGFTLSVGVELFF